jgi:hypothetical protein
MSNFRLRDPDCVLIHIPKTGGTSIRKGIWGSHYDGPCFGEIPTDWLPLFKFAFVRHPLQRFVSAWKMFTEGAKGDPQWSLPADARPLSLEEFFKIVIDESILYDERRSSLEEKIRHHTIPQTHPFNCLHLADHVARYEAYDDEVRVICQRVGLQVDRVPRMHVTRPSHWSEVLSGPLLEQVCAYYRTDLEQLGYSAF